MHISTLLSIASVASIVSAGVQLAGVNIAGCDFGCYTDGTCNDPDCPIDIGPQQMAQFFAASNLNIFRLPAGWQYLVDYQLGGSIDNSFFWTYDAIVQACLTTSAYCIIDVHNYARWYGGIIGQGGPTDDQFSSLWWQLATHYKDEPKVVFGIMNEPWGVDMYRWAITCQTIVNTIRAAGATSQMILIPGTDFTSAGAFPFVSGPFLEAVVDYDGTTDKLIYDVHQYYDTSLTGTTPECASNQIATSFALLAPYLRGVGRKALLSETGGGNTASCVTYICQALDFLNANDDVFLGWLGWAAGSFSDQYVLSLTPFGNGTNQALLEQCIAGQFHS